MANKYFVNSSDLTSVANAIREKGGTSAQLVFPSGFVSAIGDIQIGSAIQTATGTIITSSIGSATVNCEFKPDLVILHVSDSDNLISVSAGFPFAAEGATRLTNMLPPPKVGTYAFSSCVLTQTSTGFTATIVKSTPSFSFTDDTDRSISYTALKYT